MYLALAECWPRSLRYPKCVKSQMESTAKASYCSYAVSCQSNFQGWLLAREQVRAVWQSDSRATAKIAEPLNNGINNDSASAIGFVIRFPKNPFPPNLVVIGFRNHC